MMGDIEVSIQVVAAAKKKEAAFAAMEKAFAEARRIEAAVSEWQRESDASRINRARTLQPTVVGKDLMEILLYAQRASEGTDGAFDVTFPSSNRKVSYRDLQLDPKKMTVTKGRGWMRIGLSGVAKGYIVDRMAALLRGNGFQDFLINAGDIFASGRDLDGPWKIEIKNPFPNPPSPPLTKGGTGGFSPCILPLKNQAVSTSGTYERGPHIIDPRTRRPAKTDLISATMVAAGSMQADALATGIFVLGRMEGEKLLRQLPGGGGLLVGASGTVTPVGVVCLP